MTNPKIFIFPGNGGSHIETDHWYGWLRDELKKVGYEVVAKDMPDPVAASMSIWLPCMESEIKGDDNVILIGHSTGGVAILRYLETHKVFGAILVGVNHTDLGFDDEKRSGYYNDPWMWDKMKSNTTWIAQFASTDDPYINVAEPRFIHEQLDSNYFELSDRGHFMTDQNPVNDTFPEIVNLLKSNYADIG